MDSMKLLDVPLVRQDVDSLDCGIACVSMLLKYYGIEKDIPALKKDIQVFDGVGTYVPQLGKFLIDNGFHVEIITLNPHLFVRTDANRSSQELGKYFEEIRDKTTKENFKAPLRYFKEFVESGGVLALRVPTVEDIRAELNDGRPLGALITSNFLLSETSGFNFHFNIVTGIDEQNVYVNDSMWDSRGGAQSYPIHDFMYALYASAYGDLDNAALMKVRRKS